MQSLHFQVHPDPAFKENGLQKWKENALHPWSIHICPEKQVNEMHALYDKHRKVSYLLKRHQITYNSVKYEVIWKWHFVMPIHK